MKNIFKNQRILFTLNRYTAYVIKFVQGLFIAKFLGPYYLGIWGLISVLLQYFQYSSLGIQYSLNVELSINRHNPKSEYSGLVIYNSLLVNVFIGLVFILLSVVLYELKPEMLVRYDIIDLIIVIFSLGVLNNLCTIFINIYRSYDSFFKIGLNELTFNLIPFIFIFFFKDLELIRVLLYSMLVLRIIHILLFIYKFKFPIVFKLDNKLLVTLFKTGFLLMLINIGYNLFFMLIKTFVGKYYSVEEMGQFTFCFTITNAVVLGVQSFLFTMYSSILNEMANDNSANKMILQNINKKSIAYNYTVMILIMLVISGLPILFMFFDKYKASYVTLIYILLAQAFFTAGTMHATYLFAKKQQIILVKKTLSVSFVFLLIVFFLTQQKVKLDYIGLIILIFSFFYAYVQILSSHRFLGVHFSLHLFIKDNIGYIPMVIIMSLFLFTIFANNMYILFAVFPIFIFFNYKSIIANFEEIKKILL